MDKRSIQNMNLNEIIGICTHCKIPLSNSDFKICNKDIHCCRCNKLLFKEKELDEFNYILLMKNI